MTAEIVALFLLIVGGLLFWVFVLYVIVGAATDILANMLKPSRPSDTFTETNRCLWPDCPMRITHPGHLKRDHANYQFTERNTP